MTAELPEGAIQPDLVFGPEQSIPIVEPTWPRDYDAVYEEWDYTRWVVIGGYGYGTVAGAASIIVEGSVLLDALPNHPIAHAIAGTLGAAGLYGWRIAKQALPKVKALADERQEAWKRLPKF